MKALDRLVYTPTEAAEVASVSRPTIYRWMHMEGFPVAFNRWLDKQAGVLE